MKKMFITYNENGVYKKAELTEEKYSQLLNRESITEIIAYPSALLMEQNFSLKTSGNMTSKKMLHG